MKIVYVREEGGVAGIVGALLAVPCAAVANAVVNHLAGNDPPLEEEAAVV